MADRDVRDLIDQKIPYSEMTDTEIESVIEWRTNVATSEEEFNKKLEIQQAESDARIELLSQYKTESQTQFSTVADLINSKYTGGKYRG